MSALTLIVMPGRNGRGPLCAAIYRGTDQTSLPLVGDFEAHAPRPPVEGKETERTMAP
jgi:hypothetical protein